MQLTLRCCTQEIYCLLHAIIRSQILTTVNIKIKVFFSGMSRQVIWKRRNVSDLPDDYTLYSESGGGQVLQEGWYILVYSRQHDII